jgi:hypothetical protein
MKATGGNRVQSWSEASQVIGKTIQATLKGIEQEVAGRTYRASNQLRNSALIILRGTRHGRVYKKPGTHGKKLSETTKGMMGDYGHKLRGGQLYRASRPGEPPAVRLGHFRNSWGTHVRVEKKGKKFIALAAIESNLRAGKYLLGDILEDGTGRMDPRPYKQKVIDRALPKIKALYAKTYKV